MGAPDNESISLCGRRTDHQVRISGRGSTVASVTLATCERFGMIAEDLRRSGRPIPQDDIWIAAHALETGTDLLTFDRHFEAVSGLVLTLFEA